MFAAMKVSAEPTSAEVRESASVCDGVADANAVGVPRDALRAALGAAAPAGLAIDAVLRVGKSAGCTTET